ncbi:hypothetical protein G7Y89_g13727 [Cudoniella acicularis]|uniref:ER-bound oxygenase mpaB/mpaB'/Rubber oxygenase catalytic domain-containing protein n=1 Tax=Cudoniella acicularis TaxID=354080 RepID=A0A8H4R990_9HELO|nr:hypothetical protein G7Y89_g13727 [Cudoniella acicularis]
MDPLKYSYDILGEECLNRLDEISPSATGELPRNQSRVPNTEKEKEERPKKRDLYESLKEHHDEDEKLGQLWRELNTIPEWVDWEQIARGQDVFYRYGGVALTALAYQSLLGGMGAARVTEVLAEQAASLLNSVDAMKPGGVGQASSIRVRLLHAAARRRIMKLTRERPHYYSIEEFGVPINYLDSIATIATFSATLIWLGFPRQGIWMKPQEIEDYLALWRLVAHYIGTPTSYFSSPESAKAIMESILIAEINPFSTSRILANNIILSLQGQAPAYASRDFLEASARWLNGNELGDALGLGRPRLYYWGLVAGLDRKGIRTLRHFLPQLIIHNKTHGLGGETDFAFKYIPTLSFTTTDLGPYEPAFGKPRGVERRNLLTLIGGVVVVGAVGWLWVRGAVGTVAVLGDLFL